MHLHSIKALLILACLLPGAAQAFCGFYVAKADTKLFNKASQVVLVRDDDRTVLTMSNDFKGDPKEFAMVIPVPTFLEREQIHVTNRALIDHLDAYSAPRLVEYFDKDPCQRILMYKAMAAPMMADSVTMEGVASPEDLGVKIEASYSIGEYDILILSAEQSSGLITWLKQNDYRIPDGAEPVVNSYLKQGMHFFVAKVNLETQAKLGFSHLRPLQVAYESPKFMLPIRLGMVNADGPQALFVYTLTRKGRVETTNYRTVKLPSSTELPEFVKDEFGEFYKDMFNRQTDKEQGRAVFLEYAWDMNWCDPCAADPLSDKQLRELGVFWLGSKTKAETQPAPRPGMPRPIMPRSPAKDVYISRLHLRYDRAHFPEDLMFQQTGDRSNFQGRYVIRHPWTGNSQCEAAETYRNKTLPERLEKETTNLARLTGWDINDIRKKVPQLANDPTSQASPPDKPTPWWKKLWQDTDADESSEHIAERFSGLK